MTGKFVILPAGRRPESCKVPTLDASKGEERSSASTAVWTRRTSFAYPKPALDGGDCRPEDRDLGKKANIVKHKLRGAMEPRSKKTCRICRQGGGICQQGFRKTHERADPACRFHGTDVRGNVAVTRGEASRPKAHAPPRDSGRERTARPTQVHFTHMTRFVTKGGSGCTISQDLWTNG